MVKSHPTTEKSFGEPVKYDPDFNGPLKHRSCTDIICLLVFVVAVICWIGVGIYALNTGDPNSLLIPKDSLKQRCGHDSNVLDKPNLYFIDITKCLGPKVLIEGCKTKQVCVKECPNYTYIFDNMPFDPTKLICDYNIDTMNLIESDAKLLVSQGKCAGWILPSQAVTHRCFPSIVDINEVPQNIVTKDDILESIKNVKFLAQAEEMVSIVTEDIINSWWKILLGFVAALVVCFIYIVLMRWLATWVVWFSILGVVAVLTFGVYASAVKYKEAKDNPEELEANVESVFMQNEVWLVILIIVAALLILTILILLFLRKRIVIAIALIKEGSKAVSACTSALFFPIVPWIIQILLLAFCIASGLYLASVGEKIYKVKGIENDCKCSNDYKNGDLCVPDDFFNTCTKMIKIWRVQDANICINATCSLDTIVNPTKIRIMHAINAVVGLWVLFFTSAFGEMILAATFATWYWTFKKSNVPFFTVTHSIFQTMRYHIGTLAFGSLIITICRLIRIAIEYVDHKLKKYNNGLVKAILCCCKCFFWCLETFLKFLNKNAYIMCAIHGKNFCASAKDAFSLLMRNILRVFVLDKVTDLLFFLGKILITACVGAIAYAAFIYSDLIENNDLHYEIVPVVIICIGTYFISNIFFGVYSMAVDTLFLCFLEDCERNDGSPEKPYYMSKELMKILGKKNKKDKIKQN